jgi:hypothetical protein
MALHDKDIVEKKMAFPVSTENGIHGTGERFPIP